MKKILLLLAVALCVEFTGCSKKDSDSGELPFKNEYTYNGATNPIKHTYYQRIAHTPFANKYRLLFASDEIEYEEDYKDLEEYIYLEFVMGKHLNEIDCELKYFDKWPPLWMVEGRFADGFYILGFSSAAGRIADGSIAFKIVEEGVYKITFNIKIDATGFGDGFRYLTGEYSGNFAPL